jgi:hypothetical protein
MLEILLVIWLSKKIAATVKEKGRQPAGYVVLFVFLWIGGEITGAVIGMLITALNNPRALDQDFNIGGLRVRACRRRLRRRHRLSRGPQRLSPGKVAGR